ncbi:STAS domain-containing protein [Nocardia caishijiensis]|uniref:Anti-anti-sigma factor n=1 Tax=Nocardia caishijiensis TaxID=184756 RepID=A0ABQ6YM49_9NOCA|nr:STAS domain-containing protein [Nocardia caishijiensis]KAF0846857.1 anti-anti-sigma factor [Nocardia caishijiensis]
MNTNPSHVRRYELPAFDGEPPDVSARVGADLETRSTTTVLYVRGDIDAYTITRWRRVLDDAFRRASESGQLVVELNGVTFMSCRSILDLACRAQQHHDTLRVSVVKAAPSVVDRVITAAGLTPWLTVHTDLADVIPTTTDPPRPNPRVWTHHEIDRGTPTHQ